MSQVFTYGTLLFPQVWELVVGGLHRQVPAVLAGYRRRAAVGRVYPVIVPDRGEQAGRLYLDVDDAALARLDAFEGAEYERRSVTVRRSDGVVADAWTYVLHPASRSLALAADWDPAHFERKHLAAYLERHGRSAGARELLASADRAEEGSEAMAGARSVFAGVGIGCGAVALMMVLVHFWAGPFTPQPTLEDSVAEKVKSIRDATVAALKGEEAPAPERRKLDLDAIFSTGAAVLGGLALILAVVGLARHESLRVAGGAAVLGAGAIAFQFAAVAIGALIFVILVAAVLISLGIDPG